MAHTLTNPADLPGESPVRPRGILAVASPAPEGWETGGVQVSRTCPSPVIRDKCISLTDEPGRPTTDEFPAFMIEQGSACSTLTGTDRVREAREALNAATDYALGLTLATGEANDGAPSLADATTVGAAAFDNAAGALAALVCAAAAAGSGAGYVLHATPSAAVHLAAVGLIDDNGFAPNGVAWIISDGYSCEPDATEQRIWATGRVWAAAGVIDAHEAIDRLTNNREAWALRSAVVGFNTCINLTATFNTATA